jgi:hypothetical protein
MFLTFDYWKTRRRSNGIHEPNAEYTTALILLVKPAHNRKKIKYNNVYFRVNKLVTWRSLIVCPFLISLLGWQTLHSFLFWFCPKCSAPVAGSLSNSVHRIRGRPNRWCRRRSLDIDGKKACIRPVRQRALSTAPLASSFRRNIIKNTYSHQCCPSRSRDHRHDFPEDNRSFRSCCKTTTTRLSDETKDEKRNDGWHG